MESAPRPPTCKLSSSVFTRTRGWHAPAVCARAAPALRKRHRHAAQNVSRAILFARRGSFGFVVTSSSSFGWRHMLFDDAELMQEAGVLRPPPPAGHFERQLHLLLRSAIALPLPEARAADRMDEGGPAALAR